MDAIFEEFNLNILEEYEDLYVEDGEALANQWITEAQEGISKKNIFQRLWDLIKRFFSWIGRALARLFKWITSRFKKNTKTADQVMSDIMGDDLFFKIPSLHIQRVNAPKAKAAPQRDYAVMKDDEFKADKVDKKNNNASEDEEKVNFKGDIKDITKNLLLKFNGKNGFTIQFDISSFGNYHIKGSGYNDGHIPSPEKLTTNGTIIGIVLFGKFFYDQTFYSLMENLPKAFKEYKSSKNVQDLIDGIDKINAYYLDVKRNLASARTQYKAEFDLDEYKKCMKVVNDVNEALGGVELFESVAKEEHALELLNQFADMLKMMQFGINTLTYDFGNINEVDSKFRRCVDNTKDLSKIIEGFIKGGIPSRFVAYNVDIITSKDMNTTGATHMGQSRCVLFPKDQSIIYKFPINSMGIRDLKTDKFVYNKVSKHYDILAKIIKSEPNDCLMTMERLDEKKAYYGMRSEDAARLQRLTVSPEFKKTTGLQIEDVHRNNIGYRGSKAVILDYGYFNLVSQ